MLLEILLGKGEINGWKKINNPIGNSSEPGKCDQLKTLSDYNEEIILAALHTGIYHVIT